MVGQGEGNGELLFSGGIEFQDGVMKISWKWGSEDGCTAMQMNLMSLNCTLKKMVKMVMVMLCRFLPQF